MNFREIPFLDLLEKIVDNRGRTCPTDNSGIPLIATNCVRNDLLYPAYEKVRFVNTKTYNTWFRDHPKPGDMVFVTKGSPGRVCWVPNPVDFCIAQDMVAIRAKKEIVYPKFLFALLRSASIQKKIENMHVGTMIPHFKKGDFDKLLLPIPESFEIQEKIGDIYFDFCQKIELNRQTNATLEAVAQALFKEWFVHFNFPGADGELVDSELGPIPKGWRVGRLGKILDIKGGTTPSTKEGKFWGGINHWVTPKDLSNLSSPILLTTERTITDDGVKQISSGILPPGTLLLSSRAPIGYLAISAIPISINQGFIAINAIETSNLFMLHWLKENIDTVISRANGSTFLEISKSNFRDIKLIIPELQIVQLFDKITAEIFEKIKINQQQSISLAIMRDMLLPKLMNGEIEV